MAILSTQIVNTGFKDVEHTTFVRVAKPGALPIRGAWATRRLVQTCHDTLLPDFPNVVEKYTRPLPEVVNRIRANRKIARYIVLGETWAGIPMDSYSHIGMFTASVGDINDVDETHGGINVAAWLDPSATGNGYMTRLVSELTGDARSDQNIWTVVRPGNKPAIGLLSNIGMSTVGTPQMYDIGDRVFTQRQLYVGLIGDVTQTARAYADTHHPIERL